MIADKSMVNQRMQVAIHILKLIIRKLFLTDIYNPTVGYSKYYRFLVYL